MAADAYLKAAAGQLMQGADALKLEAGRIRSEAATRHQQLEREITNKQSVMMSERARSASLGNNSQSPMLQLHARQIEKEVENLKREADKVVSDAEQQARSKESAMQSLNGQAQSLQQMSADPRLR